GRKTPSNGRGADGRRLHPGSLAIAAWEAECEPGPTIPLVASVTGAPHPSRGSAVTTAAPPRTQGGSALDRLLSRELSGRRDSSVDSLFSADLLHLSALGGRKRPNGAHVLTLNAHCGGALGADWAPRDRGGACPATLRRGGLSGLGRDRHPDEGERRQRRFQLGQVCGHFVENREEIT